MHKIQDKVHNMKADVQNIYDKTKKYKEENQKKAAKKIWNRIVLKQQDKIFKKRREGSEGEAFTTYATLHHFALSHT